MSIYIRIYIYEYIYIHVKYTCSVLCMIMYIPTYNTQCRHRCTRRGRCLNAEVWPAAGWRQVELARSQCPSSPLRPELWSIWSILIIREILTFGVLDFRTNPYTLYIYIYIFVCSWCSHCSHCSPSLRPDKCPFHRHQLTSQRCWVSSTPRSWEILGDLGTWDIRGLVHNSIPA